MKHWRETVTLDTENDCKDAYTLCSLYVQVNNHYKHSTDANICGYIQQI
jgi:hypothetical protein